MGEEITFGQAIRDLTLDIILARSIRIELLMTFCVQETEVRAPSLKF